MKKNFSEGRNFYGNFGKSEIAMAKGVRNTVKGVSTQLDLRLDIQEESSLENFRSVKNIRNHKYNRSRDMPKTSTHFELAYHKQTRVDSKNGTTKNKRMMNAYQMAQ